MTTITRPPELPHGNRIDLPRRTALVAGIFYLVSFVSIPSLILYGPLDRADYLTGTGGDSGILLAAFLEIVVALAGIGTAITLFPVVKRQNETMALGFVASRTVEAAMILVGVASILSLVALRQGIGTATGLDATSLAPVAASHLATYDWAFTLGQSLAPGLNAILLGTLLYRSGLVPRILPTIGLIGAPLHLTAVALTIFGAIERDGVVALVAVVPIFVWELSLGVYLVIRGLRPSHTLPEPDRPSGLDDHGDRGPSSGGPGLHPVPHVARGSRREVRS